MSETKGGQEQVTCGMGAMRLHKRWLQLGHLFINVVGEMGDGECM